MSARGGAPVRRLAYRGALAVSGDSLRHLRSLRAWQWLAPEAARKQQEARLAGLLRYAASHVPHYRWLLGEAPVLRADGSVDLERFRRLPLLEKHDLRTRPDELTAADPRLRGVRGNTTGGSTGEPVRFLQDRDYYQWNRAVKLLFDEWTDTAEGPARALLWGSERDLFVGRETLRFRAVRWIKNELCLNAFRLGGDEMRAHVRRLNEFRPHSIQAYAESIYELARFVEAQGLRVHRPGAVLSSAGTLHPHMRETVERVFGAPVYNRYGSREFGGIACQCEARGGLHVATPAQWVEVLRPDGEPAAPGETGELVVTSLVNRAMPLIRYRIGDLAAWSGEPCGCGRGWPTLAAVHGRVTDVFVRPDGGVVTPEYVIHLIGVVLNTGWIARYQVEQETVERIRVRVVPAEGYRFAEGEFAARSKEIGRTLALGMGGGCTVEVELVERIEPTASGKHQYVLSRVSAARAR